jgi:hypothetical protein
VISVPLLVHTLNVIGPRFLWPEIDEPSAAVGRAGVLALCAAALLSPYVLAPRPFARAVTRPFPVLFAMVVAAIGAVVARTWYASAAKAAALAIGIDLAQGQADPRYLALYLLAIATLSWTLASCLIAHSEARRTIGLGLVLVVLGGYGFHWPHHFLLPLLGLEMVAEAGRRVREEEIALMPLTIEAPPIADQVWSGYIGAVTAALKRTLGDVHSLTTRGEGGLTSSLVIGHRDGLPIRTRIERIDGCVVALDVVIGREIDEVRGATLSVWAIPDGKHGGNPAPPAATPAFKTADPAFNERFVVRGSAEAFGRLLDDGLRARAIAALDGWLAYWDQEGVRYRIYPGRGSPLDHPMPLSDLALGRPATAERLVAVIELIAEIGARGVARPVQVEPSQLDAVAEDA